MAQTFREIRELEGQGRLDEAIAGYTRLIDYGVGGSVAPLRRGLLHNQLGSFTRMTADLEQAAAVGRNDPYPMMWQGQIAKGMRRPYFAASCLRAALDCSPPRFRVEMQVNLAELYLQLDWLDAAARLARQVPEEVRDWWAGTRRTSLERHRERHASARALLRRCRDRTAAHEVRLDLVRQLVSLGRLRLAGRLCEALMRERPDDFAAFELMSRLIARDRGPAEALAFLHALDWLHGGNPDRIKAIARMLHDLGRFAEVIDAVRRFGGEGHEELLILLGLAHLGLDRADVLGSFCPAWMRSTPESVPAGGFLVSAFHARHGDPPVQALPAAPRRLHIVHFWNDPDVPGDVRDVVASWRRHNPELDATLFSTATAAAFIADRCGDDAARAFGHCRHPAMQADLFRLAFLAEAGGLYADADELCLAPMSAVLARAAGAEFAAVRSGETPNFLHNYFLGATPGSPTLRRAVRMGTAAILSAVQAERPIDIWHVTGPGLATRAVGLTLAERLDTATADEIVLLPLQQYRALTRVAHELAYKQQPSNNWRLS